MDEKLAFEFAKLAFQDARSEIQARLGMREKVVEVYIVSSISLLGALLIAARFAPSLPAAVYIAAPALSLVMALLIRAHYYAMEQLARFILSDLNREMIRLGAWVPYWDYFNRTETGTKTNKTIARFLAHSCAIHIPSVISMIFFYIYVFHPQEIDLNEDDAVFSKNVIAFSVGVILFGLAVYFTSQTLSVRKPMKVETPHWWGESGRAYLSVPEANLRSSEPFSRS